MGEQSAIQAPFKNKNLLKKKDVTLVISTTGA